MNEQLNKDWEALHNFLECTKTNFDIAIKYFVLGSVLTACVFL